MHKPARTNLRRQIAQDGANINTAASRKKFKEIQESSRHRCNKRDNMSQMLLVRFIAILAPSLTDAGNLMGVI